MSKRRRLRRPVCRGTVEIKADDGTSRKRTAEHEVWGQVLVGAEASILSFFFHEIPREIG